MTATLPTAPLGVTGMDITRVGFGGWAVGGPGWASGWGPQDDDASVAAIRHAVEQGVNWIDTASVYGLGHSEVVVARALEPFSESDRPFVFTKGGLLWDEDDRRRKPLRVGDPAVLRRQVEDSLRRLGVERIDLYQMHRPAEDGHGVEDYWPVFHALVAEGKVRAVGLSNHDVAGLQAASEIGRVDAVQPRFSLVHRAAAEDVLPWCAAHDAGAIVYSPMASGLLTGSFTPERAHTLDDDDWRGRSPDFAGEGLRRNLRLADALRTVADRHGLTVGAVAIAWTLVFPGVSGAIVGARRPQQVDGWVPAAGLRLTPDDLSTIAEALRHWGSGPGPLRPAD